MLAANNAYEFQKMFNGYFYQVSEFDDLDESYEDSIREEF